MADFRMGKNDRVWRICPGNSRKLTKNDIKVIWEEMDHAKDLLISLDNCTVDEDAFSGCPFESIIIVSGNNLQNLSFINTGNNLKELGVGRFLDKEQDVPSSWGSKFPKLNKIKLSNCPVLGNFKIKSKLKSSTEIIKVNCPKIYEEDTAFRMGMDKVWRNSSRSSRKLTKNDVQVMWKVMNPTKALLLSLDNCTISEDTFSDCPFSNIVIVSGNNLQNLSFINTGNNLKELGVGRFLDKEQDVPSDLGSKFSKLREIKLSNCPVLEKFVMKSILDVKVDVSKVNCPKIDGEQEDTTFKNFRMGMDKVWRNISGSSRKLTKDDIQVMWKEMSPTKDLLLSLDNCTIGENTFSDCPFSNIVIVSGNSIENLYFIKTGNNLKKIGVGRFLAKNQDVPSVLGSDFSKLKTVKCSDCPVLEKLEIKSNLKASVKIIEVNCPKIDEKRESEHIARLNSALENFTMDDNGVWRNSSDNKIKLKKCDIRNMYKKQKKDKKQKADKLLISLDNFIVDKETFSNCVFRSITIVSGKDIKELHFEKTGGNLLRIGVGRFADANKNIPSTWQGKFPKLEKIEAKDCLGLKKIMIKSDLDVEVAIENCKNFNYDAEIEAKRNADEFFDEKKELNLTNKWLKNTSQRLANNGFKVEKPLGSGAFGVVWQCQKGGKSYAAKVVYNDPSYTAVEKEVDISQKLWDDIKEDLWEQGLIVNKTFKAIGKGGIFIAPVYSKEDALDRANSSNDDFKSMRDVQDFMESLLKSLDKLHSSGFVHRDIKLENILVKEVGDKLSYAISDYGLTQRKDNKELTTSLPGSSVYFPPETGFKNGQPVGLVTPYKSFEAAQKGDIFALGKTFMARLFKVFGGPTLELFWQQHRLIKQKHDENENKKIKDHIEDGIKDAISLIKIMMSYNPDKRPFAKDLLKNTFFTTDYDH